MISFRHALFTIISIHAPREGSDTLEITNTHDTDISIHAPREGSDEVWSAPIHFQSPAEISIHAPREGSDPTWPLVACSPCHFNPRSP